MNQSNQNVTFEDRDEFHRKSIANKLIELLLGDVDISPMILHGDWGTGKSEFCLKTIELLKSKEKVECIYIDAFKSDYVEEPIIPIILELSKLIKDSTIKREFLQKAKSTLRYGLKLTAKAGIAWLLRTNLDSLDQMLKDSTRQALDDGSDAIIDELMQDYEETQKDMDTLKDLLKKITIDNKVVMFIDELDRCKPNYSIALLEKIKHIFDCVNIKFILITNYDQMMVSVKHLYGSDVDAHSYLDKFVKFKINLPNEMYENGTLVHVSKTYLDHLIDKSGELIKYRSTYFDSDYLAFLGDLIVYSNISLRETGKFVSYLELYFALKYRGKPSHLDIWHLVSIFTIFCMVVQHNVVEKIITEDLPSMEIGKYLGFSYYTKADTYSSEKKSFTKELATLFTIAFDDKTIPGYEEFDKSEFEEWMNWFHLNKSMTPSSLKKRLIIEISLAMKFLQFINPN